MEKEQLSYNEAIKEIESILKEMQSENCDIDKLTANTKRAAELIDFCRKKLVLTESELQNVLASMQAGADGLAD